jgi:DNA-binding response OmpR family regulator
MTPRILYVDDEADLRQLVQSQLSLEGFHIDVASDGPAALAMMSSSPYDLILLDLHMPSMGGAEVVEELRRRKLHPTVIILTGESEEEAIACSHSLGAAAYLTKPFKFRDLLASVRRALNQ